MDRSDGVRKLSVNQITTANWSLPEAVDGYAKAGIPWIGVWRDKVNDFGLQKSRKLLTDAGMGISSLCWTGRFVSGSKRQREENLQTAFRAVDEAAELGAGVLVVVSGASPDTDRDSAWKMVQEGFAELVRYARGSGVRLGLEALHPMYAADRTLIVTLEQAGEFIKPFDPDEVGLVVDAFHVWWDPNLYRSISALAGKIALFQISDWIVPNPSADLLMTRGMMGDGVIELKRLRRAVEEAGYSGPIEVEIFNRDIWDRPGDVIVARLKERFVQHVLDQA